MSRTEQQPRHHDDLGTPRRSRVRWVMLPTLVVAVVAAAVSLYVRAFMPPPPVKVVVSEPAPAATGPVLSDQCRVALAAATTRMLGHADGVAANLRGHKKLMDDYKSGRIDRAEAIPQGSPWRKALARTLQQGAAAADQYDAAKAAYRKEAAQCSKGG